MRTDTAANWVANNPVVPMAEAAKESDTGLQKIGDGSTDWINLPYAPSKTGYSTLSAGDSYTKSDIGLGNVDNTSDANKPVSTAQSAALALKVNKSGVTGEYVYNFSSSKFRKFRKQLAATRLGTSGTADTKILCVGDSRTEGAGSSGSPVQKTSWPTFLRRMGIDGIPTVDDFYASQPIRTDSRRTSTGTWTTTTAGVLAIGWGTQAGFCLGYWGTSQAGATLTYTPGGTEQYDRFDVYALYGPSQGPGTIVATGGSTVNMTVGPAGPGGANDCIIQKWTASAASLSASNSVVITNTGPGQAIIVAIDPWNSTKAQVRIANAGIAGSYAQHWNTTNAVLPSASSVNCIKAYAPHLTIFDLGTNDTATPRSTAQYMADLNALIAAAQVSGDVLVRSSLPLGGAVAARDPLLRGYYDAIIAAGIPFVDVHARIGDYTSYQAAGFYNADNLHGNDYSYSESAAWLHHALRMA